MFSPSRDLAVVSPRHYRAVDNQAACMAAIDNGGDCSFRVRDSCRARTHWKTAPNGHPAAPWAYPPPIFRSGERVNNMHAARWYKRVVCFRQNPDVSLIARQNLAECRKFGLISILNIPCPNSYQSRFLAVWTLTLLRSVRGQKDRHGLFTHRVPVEPRLSTIRCVSRLLERTRSLGKRPMGRGA